MRFGIEIFKPKIKKTENDACLNCGQPFTGHEQYCSYCGQKNTSKKLSFGTFISNLFSGFLSYDSRFWTTFIPLLTKPGHVSKAYIEGKRARFVNPFQLYLNVSIIFFLVLGISNRINENPIQFDNNATINTLDSINQNKNQLLDSIIEKTNQELSKNNLNDSTNTKAVKDLSEVLNQHKKDSTKVNYYNIKSDTTLNIGLFNKINDFYHFYQTNPTLKANEAIDSLGYENTFWNNFYYQEVINCNKNWEKYNSEGWKEYVNKLFSYLSISLFIFLPIFTLFLMLLYIRKRFSYMEHLVFVFNTQTVFFLLLLIFYLLDIIINMGNSAWVFMLVFLIYLYKALRYFYGQGRFKTIVKYIILNSFYLFLAGFGLTIVAAISFVAG